MQIVVTLNEYEMLQAAVGGCQRRISSMFKGRPQFYGAGERKNYWEIDVMGAVAEYAVAKAFDLWWQPTTNQKLSELRGDVGDWQIRSTSHMDGHLFLHPNDKDANFILAIVKDNKVLLAGWISKQKGIEVSELSKFDTYWVKQEYLWSMADAPVAVVWGDDVKPRSAKLS